MPSRHQAGQASSHAISRAFAPSFGRRCHRRYRRKVPPCCAARATAPQAYAFQWDDVEDVAESVGHKIQNGWEKVEDSVIPETAEERREEAQERAEDRQEEANEEAAKRRGEHPIVNK